MGKSQQSANPKTIMIFGSPRSGTTWLGKIFDSHPQSHYLHEPEIAQPTQVPVFPPDEALAISQLTTDISSWLNARDVRTTGTRPIIRKKGESAFHHALRQANIYALKGMERLIPSMAMAGPVLQPPSKARTLVVIKTVNMLGRATLCLQAVPHLQGIHLVRHPCGQIASILRGIEKFGERFELSNSALPYSPMGKREGLSSQDLAHLSPVEILAWKWAAFNDAAFQSLSDSDRAIIVSYEEMTCDPLGSVQKMFTQLGLDWVSNVEAFIRASSEGAEHDSHYGLKRDPRLAALRWQSELSADTVQTIEAICRKTAVGRWAFSLDTGEKTDDMTINTPSLPAG
ncbi:sulfotransferase family protein [Iodidimonas muriae]|nr:sulfotransferase [Iodidimonas muriae]